MPADFLPHGARLLFGGLLLTSGSHSQQTPNMTFLSQTYRLGSYNQKNRPTWEFISNGETIDNWTTLLTVIDRPDARSRKDLDRLAEGIMSTYKTGGAQILTAKTMQDKGVFNYMVAAFEQPDKQRFELNFVKMAMGPKNAYVMIYGVRIVDPVDYLTRSKKFLTQNSSEIGQTLAAAPAPDFAALPRKEF